MNRKLLIKVLMFMVLFLGVGGSSYAQFKVEEDFKGSTTKKQNVVFKGGAYLTASAKNTSEFKDAAGDGWLRLTEDKGSQSGGVIIDEAFASEKGVVLDFEYKTWRTQMGVDEPPHNLAYRGGDGFTVFLIDGKTIGTNVTLGGTGHHLGYGGDNTGQYATPSITNGYLGLGLDEYGNYIFSGNNGYYKTHGIKNGQWITGVAMEEMRYSLKNSVGLRGMSNPNNNTPLIGFTTLDKGGYEVGFPSILTDRPSDVVFYRRVQMELYKYGNGYKVEVRWMREKGGTFEHLFTSNYTEAPFETLKIGFAASTGSAVNYHEIRGLSVFVPEGVKVEKKVNKDTVTVGEDLEYTVEVRNLSQSVYDKDIVLNDLLDNLKPYLEVESITFKSELGLKETKATNFSPSLKNLKNITINLGSRDAAVFTIKGKVKQLPTFGKLVNKATINVDALKFTTEEAKDPTRLTSTVETEITPEIPCGCPVGAIELKSSNAGQLLNAGSTYCVNGYVSITGALTIKEGAKLYVQSGARLHVDGAFVQEGGIVSICPYGGIEVKGSADIGKSAQKETKFILKDYSYFTMTGSLTQYEPVNGQTNFELGNSSIIEICGSYNQSAKDYPVLKYNGDYKNAYFIVKGDASGPDSNSKLRNSDNINVVAMWTISKLGLDKSSANFSGEKAKGDNKYLPKGYDNSKCGDLSYIHKSEVKFKKQGKYVQGDRSMFTPDTPERKGTIDYAAASMVGDHIEYTFTVKNTGNVALHDVKVNDPKLPNVTPTYKSGDINDNKLLDEGEEWIYEATYFITQEDIDNTEKVNQATVNALTDSNKVVSKISGTDYTNENPTIVPLPFGAVDNNFCDNEGDKFISGFHTTIVKTKYGFEIFGERALADGGDKSHAYAPIRILPINGYKFQGSPILATMGANGNSSTQFFLLTSKALYVWGSRATVVPQNVTSSTSFSQMALPEGVNPKEIDYMTASFRVLVLKTKGGKVYTMGIDNKLYGDGSSKVDSQWHTVKLSKDVELTNVKSVRVHAMGGFALLNDNSFVSWGNKKWNGIEEVKTDLFASRVVSPLEKNDTPKMISITGKYSSEGGVVSYFVLSDKGKVHSLGSNNNGQLGIGSTKDQVSWQVVKGEDKKDLEDVIFITGADNASHEAAAGAINKYGKLFLWGKNGRSMLGQTGDGNIEVATVPQGFLDEITGKLITKAIYVEVGGHTSMYMGDNLKFCYIGHRTAGSMGDGDKTKAPEEINSFNCDRTPIISDMCAKIEIVPEPGLVIEKTGTYEDKNGDGKVNVGDVINYTFTVTNSGNVLLKNITITDDKVKVEGKPIDLNAGEINTKAFTGTYVVEQKDIERGGVLNIATGNGVDKDGGKVTTTTVDPNPNKPKPTDPNYPVDPRYPEDNDKYKNCETCTVTILEQQPSITLVKVGVVDEDADTTAGNGVINYTFTIKNTGNVSLTVDDFIDSNIKPFVPVFKTGEGKGNRLEVGQTWTATATYNITDADVDAEQVTNQATVKGKAPKGKEVEAKSGTEQGNTKPTITPVEGGGPLITNPHIYHKVQ